MYTMLHCMYIRMCCLVHPVSTCVLSIHLTDCTVEDPGLVHLVHSNPPFAYKTTPTIVNQSGTTHQCHVSYKRECLDLASVRLINFY